MQDLTTKRISIGAGILALGLVVSTLIGGYFFYQSRQLADTLSTTGSAKEPVVSDQVKWVTYTSRPATLSSLKFAYAQMNADLAAVKSFYTSNNIPESALNVTPVTMEEVYDQNNMGEKRYMLRQTFEINSSDVQGITALAKNTQSLIERGVVFTTSRLEYSYSKLAELRISLLSKAVTDARTRAEQLVAGTGKSIGKLKSASSGVVQVLSENSIEVSDYGMYDTSTINKNVMVTVKTTFSLK